MNIIKNRIDSIREALRQNNIAACVIPTTDPHASEYVTDYWKDREHFSGFTGSAGTLVVTMNDAGLWTDSRYFLQAENELRGSDIKLFKSGEPNVPSFPEWLCDNITKGENILMHELRFSMEELNLFKTKLDSCDINLITDLDITAKVWHNRPPLPNSPIIIHQEIYAGKSHKDKISLVRKKLQQKGSDYIIINTLDEIAWLLNIRGNDIAYNPVAISYLIISEDSCAIFIDKQKITNEVANNLDQNNIENYEYNDFFEKINQISNKSIWLDTKRINFGTYRILAKSNNIYCEDSPILHFKSQKNNTELSNIKNAMLKDGIALSKFLIWFENCLKNETKIDEVLVGEKLREFRAQQDLFFGESFAPIVGFNEHGAIVHYSASPKSSAIIKKDGFLLIDSGAQFHNGTTDITRTFATGNLTDEQKKDYTLVLKGHIALAQAKFPAGTCGYQLDSLARQFLWKEGLNYGHGTGHGVGYFLCVHEGPQGIRPDTNKTELKEGMIISNEPGLYKEGQYGIRLENLIQVKEYKKTDFGHYLSFETLTLFPFEKVAIDNSLLTKEEKVWINSYHKNIIEQFSQHLSPEENLWLKEKCKPIE